MIASVVKRPAERKTFAKTRTLAWMDILILAPVLLLTAVGLLSFRQDRFRAERIAKERAQEIADALGARLRVALFPGVRSLDALEAFFPSRHSSVLPGLSVMVPLTPGRDPLLQALESSENPFLAAVLDEKGQMIYPPPYLPPSSADGLVAADQNALWRQAEEAEFIENDPAKALRFYLSLASLYPTGEAGAKALYGAGLLQLKLGQAEAAAASFRKLEGDGFSAAMTRSGLPIVPMARLQTLLLCDPAHQVDSLAAMDALGWSAVTYPSLVTDSILDRADSWSRTKFQTGTEGDGPAKRFNPIEAWRKVWRVHEMARSLSGHSPGLEPAWRVIEGSDWLTLKVAVPTHRTYLLGLSRNDLRRRAEAAMKAMPLPPYFGVAVELGGSPLIEPVAKGESPRWLAESLERFPDSRSSPVCQKVTVSLADPKLFHAMERRRQWIFGALISFAAAIAFLGIWRSRRALRRQLRLNEMKSDFVSSVSHELRTPIASVRLMAESLERGKIVDPARQQEYFRVIGVECRRLSSLIENVLDFSRIEEDRKEYEFESVDPVELVEQTVGLLQPNAEERKVRLELAFNQRRESARLDGKAIQQALINLIDNALKHSAAGAVVTVGLDLLPLRTCKGRADEENDACLVIWVEDKGPGIPSEEHERIFERFYRLGSELRRATQGVGIGLSIVKHIVEAHGGHVRLRSQPGMGSRFSIEIPQSTTNLSSKSAFQ